MIVNGLSCDVEDWFQVGAFETNIARSDWESLQHRFVDNTNRVIDLFARCGVKGSFFTLGWVAERAPTLMRRIVDEGHELASHGYDHARVFTLTAEQFRADLRRTRAILEDRGGVAITGYRAPSFSIDPRTPWAHAILAEEGYTYSSSVAPIGHDHYGWRDSARFAWHPVPDSDLVELPVMTAEVMGRRFAAGGGGFFRMLPYALSAFAVRQVNEAGHPAITYFHPWEIDPAQPRVAGASLRSRLRHYSRLATMEQRLERMLRDFRWGRVDALVAARHPVQAEAA